MREKLIIALDIADRKVLEEKLAILAPRISWVKVGMELFYTFGPEIVRFLNDKGLKVFLDLKLHDIPNTVERAAAALTRLKVAIFNVHTLGGSEMMKRAAEAVKNTAARERLPSPKVIGVTILTSINAQVLRDELGIQSPMEKQVLHLARLAQQAGLDGVVTSPLEVGRIKKICGEDFLTVVPGIRPVWSAPNDQVRILTPKMAVREGADFLVVGRPVLNAPDPAAAVGRILKEMEEDE